MVEIIDEKNFDEFIGNDFVLVDFYANWCGPCKMLAPYVEKLSNEGIKCAKINVDENMSIAERFNIAAIPLLIIFKNGNVVAKSVGYIGYDELVNFVNTNK